MKIVDVAEFYAERGGGVRTYIHQKVAAATALGHEQVIIAPGPAGGEEELDGGRVIRVKGPRFPPDPRYRVLWNERAVHAALDRERPDVVEGSSPWSGGWFVARWRGDAVKAFVFHQDPVAVYPHTLLDRWLPRDRIDGLFGWYWAYLRRLSARFDATVVAGRWLAERVAGFGLQRPVPVPFGVDKALFSPSRRDLRVRRRLLERCGRGEDTPLLVTASRFHPEKRLPTLLRAFRLASARRPLALVVYGDGPVRRRIQALAARTSGVSLAGFIRDREELATALASADLLLHGSAAETYGLAVAEALCSGLPIVVPSVGGAAELAAPAYAETYPPGDAEACGEAILRLLGRDPDDLRSACARAARDRVATTDRHFAGLFDLYGRLVRGRAA